MTAAAARSRTASPTSGRSRAASRTGQTRPRAASSPANVVRPHLRVLDQQAMRRRARRRNAAMVMFIVLIIGFFAAALAQAQLVANQHELDLLRTQIAEADAKRARLERDVEESSAPGAIIDHATDVLGMVRANDPIYLAAVGPAPEVMPVSVLGAVTASSDGVSVDGVLAASADGATDPTSTEATSADQIADSEDDEQVAAPILAGLAGTRAEATGIGTG